MDSESSHNSTLSETALSRLRLPIGGLVLASGALIGLGALALVRGLHLYLQFYSYATGMAMSRWYQTLFWSVVGGVVLSLGISLLLSRSWES